MGRRRKKNRAAPGNFQGQQPAAPAEEMVPVPFSGVRGGLLAAALVVAVFLVYQPVWQGEFLWDDDLHLLNNPVLQPGGLARPGCPARI